MKKNTVAIIGSSLSANLAAAYLQKQQKDLRIVTIGPRENKRPVVGESLTEFSAFLMHQIGLGNYLEKEQFPKYGLTFYFKDQIENPKNRVYAMHEALALPPLPSHQLNRFTFDKDLQKLNSQNGIEFIDGKVTDCSISSVKNTSHSLTVQTATKETQEVHANWIIDASGRSQFLANRFNLKKSAPYQRSTFWFRLVNYDESILKDIDARKPAQYAFDSHFATHHFFGKGNWIWCIPMRTTEYENMISIGLVWRPDVYPYEAPVNKIEKFLQNVGQEHEVITELVNSGEVIDTNFYSNYLYEVEKLYSDSGWFILGDAGFSVDPLYSTGIVTTSLQITQIEKIIDYMKSGDLPKGFTKDLESTYVTLRNTVQTEISTLYEAMHDPYESHWRVHLISAYYFFFLLPCWLSGYISHQTGARFIRKLITDGKSDYQSMLSLLKHGSKKQKNILIEEITNKYKHTVNWDLWGPAEKDIPRHLSHLLLLYSFYRFRLLKKAGWNRWPHHLYICIRDIFRAGIIRLLFSGKSFKDSPIIEKFVSKIETEVVPFPQQEHPENMNSETPEQQKAA